MRILWFVIAVCLCCSLWPASMQAEKPKDPIVALKAYMDQIKAAHFAKDWEKKAELTKLSLPSSQDWQQVLTPEGWKQFDVAKFDKDLTRHAKDPKKLARLYRIRKTQPDYHVDQATTEQLRKGKHGLPGGMRRVAPYLQPGILWVRLKLTAPGKRIGMSYTVFAHVNQRWILFPKPWRYVSRPEKIETPPEAPPKP